MDEKEQADRLAAAEALYMISTRVDKNGAIQKSPRISRKKRASDQVEDRSGKRKVAVGEGGDRAGGRRGRSRSSGGGGRRGAVESRGGGGSRGRGSRGGGSSPRGRGAAGKAVKSQQRQTVGEAVINYDAFKGQNNNGRYSKHNLIVSENVMPLHHGGDLKPKSKGRTPKVKHQKTKSNAAPVDYASYHSQEREAGDEKAPHQAIGFTGVAISLSDSSRRGTYDSSQALQSHGLVSGLKQVTLSSRTLSSATPVFSLASMNLASFTPDLNLPSIPLEIGSLQLSSQPTPNLSSLGDLGLGVLEDDCSFASRKKSEKFLPLKKRKLHNPTEPEAREEAFAVEASLSDSEERSEPQSPPPPAVEPFRASFTVQAPPIITMQTLMEIKTALTADDDGDLPLHIAVVHENMRMVIKLITLMKIAGKGVDKFNKQQQTPLHLAVKLNFLEAVDILLKSNANVNAVDCTGSSCIHMAVQGKSTECLTMLLERCLDADLNARNFDGLTPLHIAVDNGDLQQVETLLKYNADIDVTDGKSGRTALFWAAESNQKGMVELLLGKGANPDVPNYAGVTTAMAAQGRNLHGVLKLLGSVATDKFTEFDVKPNLESKPSPLYLGFPPSDNLAFSHPSVARSISLSKHTGPEVTCLVEPKISMETLEIQSNETKVFKNVFVLSQNQTKSMSEPSSPEVKMEVTEDKNDEAYGRSGLMSLPESIFSKREENKGVGQFGKQRKMVVTGLGGSLFTARGKLQLPVVSSNVVKKVEPAGQRDEQKSVVLHMVPSFCPSEVTGLTSSQNTVQSSNTSSELGVSASKPASNASSASSSKSSATPPLSSFPSSNETVTLTSMQARLFQMLLKKYNIDPSNEVAASSNDSRHLSTTLPTAPTTWTSAPASSPLTTSLSVTFPYQKQGTQSLTQKRVQISGGNSVVRHEQVSDLNVSSNSFNQQSPLYQHKLVAVLGNNHSQISENGIHIESEDSKSVDRPLNLSTTSNRQDISDSRSMTSSKVKSEVLSYARQPLYSSQFLTGMDSSMVMKMNPAQLGSMGKVISLDVQRVPEHARNDEVSSRGTSQFEMFLLQDGQAQIPISVASGHSLSVATLLSTQSEGNVPQIKPAGKQSEQKPLVDAALDSSHITSVSQKTAYIVRDFLSHHNQIRTQSQTFSSQPVSTSALLPTIQPSVPTVLELTADNSGSTLQKHVAVVARNPVVSMGKSASFASSSVSSTVLQPTASTSPLILHQGHVIDLSRGKGKEANSLPSSLSLPLPSGSSGSGQGKVIGFSGAVLSVAPSKLDRVEKRPPREATPKEFPKKRGRKSQKSLLGLALATETGLGKINSETDEKLKKFLDAKKSENSLSVLSNAIDEMSGLQDEQTNCVKEEMENNDNLKVLSEPQYSEGYIDKTYKTVGIFSGNVQHVKVGKKPTISSHVPTFSAALLLPLSLMSSPISPSSPTSPSSHDNKPTDVGGSELKSPEGEWRDENIDLTSSTLGTSSLASKNCDYTKLASTKTSENETLGCEQKFSENDVSNYSGNCSGVILKAKGTKLPADANVSSSKKSKKITVSSSCVKEKISSLLSKTEAGMQASSSKLDSNSSNNSISEENKKHELSGMKSKAKARKVKGNTDCGIKEKETNLSIKSSLETVKRQERDSGVCDDSQALSSNSDSVSKHKKPQRRKRLGFQEKGQIPKALPVDISRQCPFDSPKPSICDSNMGDLTSKSTVQSDIRIVVSSQLSDDNRSSERADVFKTDVATADDDDDDDFDGQPTLVIEEAQPEIS
ncbi:hypothetical protein BsWGS_17195 [Bradybaena similaris]